MATNTLHGNQHTHVTMVTNTLHGNQQISLNWSIFEYTLRE